MFTNQCRCINCITPPHILKKLLENPDSRIRDAALRTLLSTSRLRGERAVRGLLAPAMATSTHGRRTVFDCANSTSVSSATVARTENGPASADNSVNDAFDGLGSTRDFYKDVLDRDSIDGRGMRLNGYVHFGSGFNNAFWDGSHMIFGDGDGVLFTDFTRSLDVIAHELTHGVTELTAGLVYHKQPGALNESMSDVFGSLVKQWARKQTADQADWLIGAEIFTPEIDADALRSMKAPGTAYNNPLLGRDPQPDNMSKFVMLPDTDEGDNGGVHINSGIPEQGVLSHRDRHRRIRLGSAGTHLVHRTEGIFGTDQFPGIRRSDSRHGRPALRGAERGATGRGVCLEGGRHPHQWRPGIGRGDQPDALPTGRGSRQWTPR